MDQSGPMPAGLDGRGAARPGRSSGCRLSGGLAQFLKWWRVERKFPTDRYRHEDASTMDSSVAPFEAPDKVPLSLQSRSRLWGQCET